MKSNHIPYSLIFQDEESELHERVCQDVKFRRRDNAMKRWMDENIADDTLKAHIIEESDITRIFAEAAAYREGFQEGLRFLLRTLRCEGESLQPSKREQDFSQALERFLADYRLDRIADMDDFLEKDMEYKKIHLQKLECENALQVVISRADQMCLFLEYSTAVDDIIDAVKTIFYEHGFQDCAAISRVMQEGWKDISLRTLLALDAEV